MKQHNLMFLWLLTALMLLVGCQSTAQAAPGLETVPVSAARHPDEVRPLDPPLTLQDFSLSASTGDMLALSDLQGDWLLVFFGYIHCPDFCPMTLVDFQHVKDALGSDAEHVQFVYISVDGLRDTPDIMQAYLDHFDPTFIGLTGNDETLERIQTDYGFYYRRAVTDGVEQTYSVDHSTRSYLIDPDGRLRASFAYQADTDLMAVIIQDYIRLDGLAEREVD